MKLRKEISESQEARLWRIEGCRKLAMRLAKVAAALPGKDPKSQLAAALGIGKVSLYKALKGECLYSLFFKQIAPAEKSRMLRRKEGDLTEAELILSELQWTDLNLPGLIKSYAPSLLTGEELPKTNPLSYRFEESFGVAQDLVEETIPIIRRLVELDCELRRSVKPIDYSGCLQSLPFPAGIAEIETVPYILGFNRRLASFLGFAKSKVIGQPLGNLFSIALQLCPERLQEETARALNMKLGSRRATAKERGPFCYQFHIDNTSRKDRYRGMFSVTLLVVPCFLGKESKSIFGYHLKELQKSVTR